MSFCRPDSELGFVIHDPELARQIEQAFVTEVPRRSYTLRLSASGAVEWLDTARTPAIVHRVEPGSTWWSRALLQLMSLLPIDWLL